MKPPLLSIVIPAQNAAAHLRTLPDRLAAIQDHDLPIEVVIVVSGVDDEQRAEIGTLSSQLPDARVIALDEPLTVGPARNLGLDASTAPHVTFLDVDDVYDLPALIGLVTDMTATRVGVGVGSYRVQSARKPEKARDVVLTENPERVLDLLHEHAAVWRYVFDRHWLDEKGVRFDPLPFGEDLIFLIDVDAQRPTLHGSPRVHYTYIVDQPTQASGINSKDEHRRLLLAELSRRAALSDCPDDVQRLLAEWFVRSWAVGVRNAARRRHGSTIGALRAWHRAKAPMGALISAIPRVARSSPH